MNRLLQTAMKTGCAIGLALTATLAQADGFYIGAGAYQAAVEHDGFDEEDTVAAAFAGYQFVDTNVLMVSAELGYYDLGSYSETFANTNIDIDVDAFTLAGVVYLPIGPLFEIYAKAGVASVTVDLEVDGESFDEDGEEAFGGAGFAFDVLDTVDIYAEYLVFDTEVDSDMMGVGVRFDF